MSHHTAKKALWTKGSEEFVVQISVGLGSLLSQTGNVEFKVIISIWNWSLSLNIREAVLWLNQSRNEHRAR